jgi:DNA-binding XRE family transcriptional regulator
MSENIIKTTCKELGVTQKELAERIGVAEQTIYNWNSGKEIPEWGAKSIANLLEAHKHRRIVEAGRTFFDLLNK